MIESRRTFLRACIAGAGMILVPKYADAYRWKARPSGIVAPEAPDGSLIWQLDRNENYVLWARWQGAWIPVAGMSKPEAFPISLTKVGAVTPTEARFLSTLARKQGTSG